MTEQEHLKIREVLNQALEESYKKMLRTKAALGQSIVTVNAQGELLEMPAKDAWEQYKAENGND